MPATTIASTTALASPAQLLPAFSMIAAGLALIFVVGFAPMAVAHNAAHDTRHSVAFPCH